MATRERIVSSSTAHLNSAWAAEQTEEFLEQTSFRNEKPAIVIHDRDTKFTQEFIDKLPPLGPMLEEVITVERDEIVVRSCVGGLVRSFERQAA